MLHAYIQRFDVMGSVRKYLGTEHGCLPFLANALFHFFSLEKLHPSIPNVISGSKRLVECTSIVFTIGKTEEESTSN